MVLFNFIFYYIVKSCREAKKRGKAKNGGTERKGGPKRPKGILLKTFRGDATQNERVDVERNECEDVVDVANNVEVNVETQRRPFISNVILIWGILEILSLAVILTRINKTDSDNYENFMKDLCISHQKCQGKIFTMIAYKILVSVFLVIGAKFVSG